MISIALFQQLSGQTYVSVVENAYSLALRISNEIYTPYEGARSNPSIWPLCRAEWLQTQFDFFPGFFTLNVHTYCRVNASVLCLV